MRIKVCGLTQMEQFLQLDELGVDFGGFIFYPQSPRYALNHLTTEDIYNTNGKQITKVGVFVNEQEDVVLERTEACGLTMVQLHGDETPHYCEKIVEHVTVIKAFRINDDDDILWKVKDYEEVADMYLFDTLGSAYGGTGKRFDWSILKGLSLNKPFFLSGGIGPEDVDSLNLFTKDAVAKDLFSIDVNSQFESAPGVKNIDLLKVFIGQIRNQS